MGKRILIIILILVVVLSLATIEKITINNTFKTMKFRLLELNNDILQNNVHIADAINIISYWEKQKRILYMIMPHIEIRTIDTYLYQLKNAIEFKKYFEASEYIDVLISQTESIPKSFIFCIENIL